MRQLVWLVGVIAVVAVVVGFIALARQASVRDDLAELTTQITALGEQLGTLQADVASAAEAEASTPLSAADISDEDRATAFFKLVNDEAYAFTWHYENDAPAGFYEGSPPHGGVLRTFLNDIAYDAVERKLGVFPEGSIIVKENHVPGDLEIDLSDDDRAVENFAGNLDSTTLMIKINGYNPDAADWFWAKLQPDGTIDAAGKPEGCIGCHQQVASNDWVYDAQINSSAVQR